MANTIKGLLPSGKAPSVLKAEIIELIKTEAPAPDLTPYATTEVVDEKVAQVQAQGAVKRQTLVAPKNSISTSGWDTELAHALVLLQDAAGERKATYEGEEIPLDFTPGAATITAWVYDGTGWVWRSSAAEPAPTSPPTWADGTTVSNGTIAATSAEFIFSQPLPTRVAVQYRAGSADSWRTVSAASSTVVKVAGLTPTTSYPAFDFQLINAAGASSMLTAQPFQTPVKPPGWEVMRHATFTTTGKTPISSYTPDIGEQFTIASQGSTISVADGATLVEHGGKDYAAATLRWSQMPVPEQAVRISTEYQVISGNENVGFTVFAGVNNSSPRFSVTISATAITGRAIQNVTLTETSGKTETPPTSGMAVCEVKDGKVTLTINGVMYRSWDLNVNNETPFQRADFVIGGQSLHSTRPIAPTRVSEIKVEAWV
ncbi:hypothetical protein [Rothia nasimurium]|uniref:hypothetical protein n=1 Tax=Rothia nasimurium TaxID=85336 RepID=UPI001F18A9F2|nr:hypothetical protein [Rothia nasimurium]